MCSMEFKIVMISVFVSGLLSLIGYLIYMIFDAREKCPHCGSRKIDVIKVKGNKITSKCRKCGRLSDRYESFYQISIN